MLLLKQLLVELLLISLFLKLKYKTTIDGNNIKLLTQDHPY